MKLKIFNISYENNFSDNPKYNSPILHFHCRNQKLESKMVTICDDALAPDFFILKEDLEIAKQQPEIVFLEPGPSSIYDEETYRCVTTFPYEVKNIRGKFQRTFLADCYSDDTEILTKNDGWILFKNLTKNHQVACLSQDDHTMYWHNPIDIIKYHYKGKMIETTHRSVKLCVTPNHKLYMKDVHSDKYNFKRADNPYYKGQMVNRVNWEGTDKKWFYPPQVEYNEKHRGKNIEKIPMDDWLKFLGWFIADGSVVNTKKSVNQRCTRISITQLKKENFEEIKNCIKNIGFDCSYIRNSFMFYNKQIWSYLKDLGKAHQKYIPQEFMNLSKRQLKILFNTMMSGDGDEKENGFRRYSTTSKKLANQVQEILMKIGYNSSIHIQKPSRCKIGNQIVNGKHIVYRIIIRRSRHCSLLKNNHYKKINYNGMVYCCTVPEHIILVRRKGYPVWSGNCKWIKRCIQKMQLNSPYIEVPDDYVYRWITVDEIKECEEFDVPIRIIYWDIETDGSKTYPEFNGFEDADKCPIISIAAFDSYTQKFHRFLWKENLSFERLKKWMRIGKYYVPAENDYRKYNNKYEIVDHCFDNECDMLRNWFRWFGDCKPDGMMGFNSEGGYRISTKKGYSKRYWFNGFDNPYLYKRAESLDLLEEMQYMSPLTKGVRMRKYGDKTEVVIEGVTQIDFLYANEVWKYHEKYNDFRGGNLESYGSFFLGFGKVKHDKPVFKLWNDCDPNDYDPTNPEMCGVEISENLVKKIYEKIK